MRFLGGVLLLVFAFAHLAVWLPPHDPERHAFDAKSSRLLLGAGVDERGSRLAAVGGALAVAAAFVLAGFGIIRGSSWAPEATSGAAVLSMLLIGLYFNPWLLLFVVVDLAIIAVVL